MNSTSKEYKKTKLPSNGAELVQIGMMIACCQQISCNIYYV